MTNDLISRAAVMFVPMPVDGMVTRDYAQGFADAIDAVLAIPAAEPQRWMPVSEKVPEGNGKIYEGSLEESNPVLVYGNYKGQIGYGLGRYIRDRADPDGDGWNGLLDGDWDLDFCEVVAWMPIPELWKGEE